MDDDKDKDKGKILIFPGGKRIDQDELGSGSENIISQSEFIHTPELLDTQALSKDLRDRELFVSSDNLLNSVSNGSSISQSIDIVFREISEELAHLKYERKKAIKDGKPSGNITIARIASLRSLADALMKKADSVKADQIDLQSPRMTIIIKLWMEFLYSSMEKVGIEESKIDLVFRQMQADMKDWELKVLEH